MLTTDHQISLFTKFEKFFNMEVGVITKAIDVFLAFVVNIEEN